MSKIKGDIERGDVYWARLDPALGSEIQKTRPVVVVSINPLNKARKTVVIAPLSTSAPAIDFLNVALKGGSVAQCEHIRAVDKSRLSDKIGSISNVDMNKIEDGISRILSIHR